MGANWYDHPNAEIVGEITTLIEWLREPDHAERFTLADATDWMNRRPVGAAERARAHALALLNPAPSPGAQS